MTDSALRLLEMEFRRSRTVQDEAAWLRARVQAGELERARLELAAYCGSQAAITLVAVSGPKTSTDVVEGLVPWANAEVWRRTALALLYGAESVCPNTMNSHAERIVRLLEDDVACRCEEHWAELVSLPNPPYPHDPGGRAIARAARYAATAAKYPEDGLQALQEVVRTVAGAIGEEGNQVRALCEMLRDSLVPWALGYFDPVRERVEARQTEPAGE